MDERVAMDGADTSREDASSDDSSPFACIGWLGKVVATGYLRIAR